MTNNLDIEVWKPIKGYENLYEVSNLGNIKSLSREIITSNNKKYFTKCKILKKDISNKGYYRVIFKINKKSKHYSVSRLVAEAFIPNPNNLPCVNHKDENPLNNCVSNLEWCTHKYNMNYGTRNQRISKNKRNKEKINQYDLQGNYICPK